MKRAFLIAYLIFSISLLMTTASWLTWGSSCQDIHRLVREGDSYNGMCAGDGIQYVGVFCYSVMITIAFLAVTALVMKVLKIKLSK